jgi:hypothetical protein
VNNRRSWRFPSELVTRVRVADGQREEAKANGQHDDVQHFGTPCGARCADATSVALAHHGVDPDQDPDRRDLLGL